MCDHPANDSLIADRLLADRLLTWFGQAARDLPWRRERTPYRVWLAEIMLQQTQVATVIPYYERFLIQWPDFAALASAEEEQVLKAWEGLGYYSRARNLRRAAVQVVRDFNGMLPHDDKMIRSLPGIGEYTAGAIGSIAFGLPIAAVDGNVVRVFSRLKAIPWNPADPADRRVVRKLVESALPHECPGDYNEALMDLGATICLPRSPDCDACPLADICLAHNSDRVDAYPARQPVKVIPVENKVVLVFIFQGLYHVRRRPDHGLLAGLYEFDWLEEGSSMSLELLASQGARITDLSGYTHRFTHRIWQLTGYRVELARQDAVAGRWVTARDLESLPFPTALQPFRSVVLTPAQITAGVMEPILTAEKSPIPKPP